MTMRTTTVMSSLVLALATGACAPPTAPAKPSWAEDVQPIVQGSCSSCHGPTADVTGLAYRFDICDPAAFADTGYVFPKMTSGAVTKGVADFMKKLVTDGPRPTMPPPPAGPLSDYERDVIVNWDANRDCGKRANNHKPTVKLVGKLVYADGDLTFTVEVDDADAETVVGTVTAGDPPVTNAAGAVVTGLINNTGRTKITMKDVPADTQPVHVKISDGWTLVEKDL